MALTSKKYESIHSKTGADLTKIKANFDNDHHEDLFQFEPEAALLYQIQKMQEELDYLRTEISSNKGKSTFPGFGKTNSTALAGDTTTISTAQANAITANTAKTSMVIGKGANEAMAGNTTIPNVTVSSDSGLVVHFGNLKAGKTGATADLTITDHNQKSAPTYTVQLTLK